MRFFYAVLNLISIGIRIGVVASPFAFSYFQGANPDSEFITSSHQMILIPIFSLVYAFIFFFPALHAYTVRDTRERLQRGGASRAPEEDTSTGIDFNWMIPGTAEYFSFHNGSALE